MKIRSVFFATFLLILLAPSPKNTAGASSCNGRCSIALFAGPILETEHSALLMPPWQWEMADAGLVGTAISYTVHRGRDLWAVELELGLDKRYGDLSATEAWTAIYFRWLSFPWNSTIRTSLAISTGINYATAVERFERALDNHNRGSKLLHYLSPEMTFALPYSPDHEMVVRLHHRSGGANVIGYVDLFNGTGAGIDALLVGYRKRF